jgi:type IX secretion system PorP/SprF family membrane protein
MKALYIISIILCISVSSFAQQEPMYSEYVFDGLLINPAFAGSHDALNAMILYRNQWVNVPGAPKTGVLSLDAPLKNPKVGLGLNVELDKIGVSSHSQVSGAYSYRISFAKSTLIMGLSAGVAIERADFTSVRYSENGQPDEAFQEDYNEILPAFGLGVHYFREHWFAGISIPQIAGYALHNMIYDDKSINLDLANHYFVYSGYRFDISPDLKLKPSVLLKYVNGAPLEFDVNGVAYLYDILAIGISYRSLASVNFLAQVKVYNQLSIGYAYEYSTTGLNSFKSGSHEIMLQYMFDFSHARIVTPRFF